MITSLKVKRIKNECLIKTLKNISECSIRSLKLKRIESECLITSLKVKRIKNECLLQKKMIFVSVPPCPSTRTNVSSTKKT